jgi:hypothetical protein
MNSELYRKTLEHSKYYVLKFMDALRLLQHLPALTRFLAGPILEQVANIKSLSTAIGFIFMLLIVTSIVETFVIGLFCAIRIFLISALVVLLCAELFKSVLLDVRPRVGQNGAALNMED